MARFRKIPAKPVEVEATQWFKNGDHPKDDCREIIGDDGEPFLSEGKVVRRFRRPDVDGGSCCAYCGKKIREHGWINTGGYGDDVCPGNWIITNAQGEISSCSPGVFEHDYEPVED